MLYRAKNFKLILDRFFREGIFNATLDYELFRHQIIKTLFGNDFQITAADSVNITIESNATTVVKLITANNLTIIPSTSSLVGVIGIVVNGNNGSKRFEEDIHLTANFTINVNTDDEMITMEPKLVVAISIKELEGSRLLKG